MRLLEMEVERQKEKCLKLVERGELLWKTLSMQKEKQICAMI